MKSSRTSRIGNGVSPSAFEDDGIPNSPFKSSKSAAMTFALFGVALGGLFVICGATMAITHAQKNAPTPTAQVARIKPAPAEVAPQVATLDGTRKRYISPARTGKTVKRHVKSKSATHVK